MADPVPALLAKARWERASAMRARRTTLLARRRESPRPWAPIAVAAGVAAALLLALAGSHRSPGRNPVSETPVVEQVSDPEEPLPAPRVAVRPRPEPAPAVRREEAPAIPRKPEEPVVRPDPEPPAPPPAPARETVEAPAPIARVERTAGAVALESGRAPSEGILAGETLHVSGPSSRAVVAYPDGTRLYAGGDTSLTLAAGKAVTVARGEVAADVAPQPRGSAVVFTTPGAEVKVLGTRLAIVSRPESTWVQVEKGRVQVTRRSDRWSIALRAGQVAVVEAGALPVARPLAANLASDPGFEAGGTGWGGIWNRAMGRNYGGVDVTADAPRALRLTTDRATGRDREVFQDFTATPGETVEASGWLRTAGVGGKGVTLSLVWLSASGSFLEDLTAALRAKGWVLREDVAGTVAGTSDWTRLAARAVAPPQAKQVRLLVYADADPSGPAHAWFDDAVFRRVPRAGR